MILRRPVMAMLILAAVFLSNTNGHARQSDPALNLMPMPAEIQIGEGQHRIDSGLAVELSGNFDARLHNYVMRFIRRLSERTGLFLRHNHPVESPAKAQLQINCQRIGKLQLNENEDYQLQIGANTISLIATTDLGAMRGLETLLQLLDGDKRSYFFPVVDIKDEPRFPWRGLMLDVSRHFISEEGVLRQLDAMAALKMNVFHWHLTDHQGFRIESKRFPLLHQKGANGQYYTHEQVRRIVNYAAARGIRVVPEFDVPAHTTSWFVGYPELASQPGPYKLEESYREANPTMNPVNEGVYLFLERFFEEMGTLFPDQYVHIGGDENNGHDWLNNKDIAAFMRRNGIRDKDAMQAHFIQRIQQILAKQGKIMIGWDEIYQAGLAKTAVIQSWRGKQVLYDAARKGHYGILSAKYYLDLIQPASYHYKNDPLPSPSPLPEDKQANILGGEAAMWTELTSAETVDSRIWPRTASIAERLWSPAIQTDLRSMYERLEHINYQLEEHGLLHLKNYEMMLRRMLRGGNIAALKTLVDVVEPIKWYRRHRAAPYTVYSPLTRVVDAAQPESLPARLLGVQMHRYLAKRQASDFQALQAQFEAWAKQYDQLLPEIERSPVLREIEVISKDLAELGEIGLTALELLKNKQRPTSNWVSSSLTTIEQSRAPRAKVRLMICDTMEKLVQRVAGKKAQ